MNGFFVHKRLASERSRIRAVLAPLSAALRHGAAGDPAYVPFYLAAARYLEAILPRLYVQSARAGEMIRSKLGKPDAASTQAFLAFDQCLATTHRHLADLSRRREQLEREGIVALEPFEQFIDEYSRFITANMGHHHLIVDLAEKHLSLDDWAYMASMADEEMRRELSLYEQVLATVPPGLQTPGLV